MALVQSKSSAAWLSVISNGSLVVLKLLVGLLIGSVAVIAEAIHSGLDLLASLLALFSVKRSGKPPDQEHPFGHGKIENVSGTVEGLLILVAAIWIVYEAVHKLLNPGPLEDQLPGVAVMGFSAVANLLISRMLFRVAAKTNSVALEADAWHLRTDVWTSVGVMAGLAWIKAAGTLLPAIDFDWLDPVVAIGVALMIVNAALRLTIRAARDLLDVSLPDQEQQMIQAVVVRRSAQVRGMHELRTRKAGHQRFIEFHLLVDPVMTVEQSHDLAEGISAEIETALGDANVTVHVEPCDGSCEPKCVAGCRLPEKQRPRRGQQQQGA